MKRSRIKRRVGETENFQRLINFENQNDKDE